MHVEDGACSLPVLARRLVRDAEKLITSGEPPVGDVTMHIESEVELFLARSRRLVAVRRADAVPRAVARVDVRRTECAYELGLVVRADEPERVLDGAGRARRNDDL